MIRLSSEINQHSVFPSVIVALVSEESHMGYNVKNPNKSVKFLQSVMLWGCMSATGVGWSASRKGWLMLLSIKMS